MKLQLKHPLLIIFSLMLAPAALADSEEEIRTALLDLIGPAAETSTISKSPMQGVYQVNLGERVVFISKQGDHMLLGDLFDTKRRVSLSEELKQQRALGIINGIDEKEMIVFAPKITKRTITVYTDVDCPYCRKLHKEVPELVKNGIKVRYLWYPRSGINTPSYDKAVSVWCAKDQQAAMNDAKLNDKITPLTCDPNPVARQFESGQRIGVRGTPTIVLDDGTIIGGYLPAKDLLASLGIDAENVAEAAKE